MSATLPEVRLIEDEQSIYLHAFDEQTRRVLSEDDAAAWRAVCGLLITVISFGLLFGILAVLLAV